MEIVTEINALITNISSNKNAIDEANHQVSGVMDEMLKTFTEAQAQGLPVQQSKVQVFKLNGWTYKEFDPQLNKMVTWEGDKAPGFVSTLFSQATKAETLFGSLGNFQTWGEMLKRCKAIDILTDLKKEQGAGHKVLKKIKDTNFQSEWVEWYKYEIKKLNTQLERDALNGNEPTYID